MENIALILSLAVKYGPAVAKAAVALFPKTAFPEGTEWDSFFDLFDKPAEQYLPASAQLPVVIPHG